MTPPAIGPAGILDDPEELVSVLELGPEEPLDSSALDILEKLFEDTLLLPMAGWPVKSGFELRLKKVGT